MCACPLGFRIKQPARELVFLTPSGRAESSSAFLPDVIPAAGTLTRGTMRSHDQWNTTIYSDDDRYRGIKNLRTLAFMNRADMRERGIADLGPVDNTSTAKDGGRRSLNGYLAIPYDIPRGCAAGYMPEMNVPVRAQRLQHPERPADHEARQGHHRPRRLSGSSVRAEVRAAPPRSQRTSPRTSQRASPWTSPWTRSGRSGDVRARSNACRAGPG